MVVVRVRVNDLSRYGKGNGRVRDGKEMGKNLVCILGYAYFVLYILFYIFWYVYI